MITSKLEDRYVEVLHTKLREKSWVYKTIYELRNSWKDEDVYVVGSGASLDYIPTSFFDNKKVIGVNSVYHRFRCDYTVTFHTTDLNNQPFIQQIIDDGQIVITTKRECGCGTKLNDYKGNYYIFENVKNKGHSIDLSVLDSKESLVVGGTIAVSAIHLAYYLGAKTIMLCGMDCGELDNSLNFDGYNSSLRQKIGKKYERNYETSYLLWNKQITELTKEIRKRGITVCSLNPFINFGLEGHKYRTTNVE